MDILGADFWIENHYPTTLVKDRHNGEYSGGIWTCWPVLPYEVPVDVYGDQISNMFFWGKFDKSVVGIGNNPDEAIIDLEDKLRKLISKTE